MSNRSSLLLSAIFLTIVVLAVVQLVVSNKLSTSGVLLSSIKEQSQLYQQENKALDMEIAKTLSITNLVARAKDAGFVKDYSPLVVSSAQSFALK